LVNNVSVNATTLPSKTEMNKLTEQLYYFPSVNINKQRVFIFTHLADELHKNRIGYFCCIKNMINPIAAVVLPLSVGYLGCVAFI